jgi:hypothetical protein
MSGKVAHTGDCRVVYSILWRDQSETDHLGRPNCRWEDDIKMDIKEVGWKGINWIELDKDRESWRALVNAVMNFWVPKNNGIS